MHEEKAPFPIDVRFDVIETDVNDEHPENAYDPIEETDDGIVIDVRLWQY